MSAVPLRGQRGQVGVGIGQTENSALDQLRRNHAEGNAVSAVPEDRKATPRVGDLADRRPASGARAEATGPSEPELRVERRQ